VVWAAAGQPGSLLRRASLKTRAGSTGGRGAVVCATRALRSAVRQGALGVSLGLVRFKPGRLASLSPSHQFVSSREAGRMTQGDIARSMIRSARAA